MRKQIVYWVTDAYGIMSCHINTVKLNHEQSKLGYLVYENDEWYYKLCHEKTDKKFGPFTNQNAAKLALLNAIDGEIL